MIGELSSLLKNDPDFGELVIIIYGFDRFRQITSNRSAL
jgi:hypothetical protein